MRYTIVITFLLLLALVLILPYNTIRSFKHENQIAKHVGKVLTYSNVDYIVPTENKNEFICSSDGIWLLNVNEKKVSINKDFFPDNIDDGKCIVRILRDFSPYIINSKNGYLYNPKLELVRNDIFHDFNIEKAWISPTGEYLILGDSFVGENRGLNIVLLPSKKVVLNSEGHPYIGLVSFNDAKELYFLSIKVKRDKNNFDNSLFIRSSRNWNTIKTLPIGNTVIYPDCILSYEPFNDHKGGIILGTDDGKLIFLNIPSFKVQNEVSLSSDMISSMCKINYRTIAVGNIKNQIYLVDTRSLNVLKLPHIKDRSGITSMTYQANSKILSIGDRVGNVDFWRLKEAAFVVDAH